MQKYIAYKFIAFRCEVEAEDVGKASEKAEEILEPFKEDNFHSFSPILIIGMEDLEDNVDDLTLAMQGYGYRLAKDEVIKKISN